MFTLSLFSAFQWREDHITVLHHGFYAGAISIWGGLARPNGRASKHDQMFIELNSLDLNVSTSSEVEAGETADHA